MTTYSLYNNRKKTMPIKSLTDAQKTCIIEVYQDKNLTQKEIAQCMGTSQRTINRVLVEAGLLTPVPRIQAEAYTVMQVLKKHGIDPSKLDQTLSFAENITKHEVETFLLTLTDTETSELFYNVAMHKFEMQLETVMAESSMATQYLEAMDEDLPF